jgi:hypothetical protein
MSSNRHYPHFAPPLPDVEMMGGVAILLSFQ